MDDACKLVTTYYLMIMVYRLSYLAEPTGVVKGRGLAPAAGAASRGETLTPTRVAEEDAWRIIW